MSETGHELGWCSWCFKRARHELMEQNYLRRNVYQCTSCLNRTLVCRYCKDLARGHEGYDDERCVKCDGTIERWGQVPPPREAYCSWCFDRTKHKLIQRSAIQRDVYECGGCGRRTLPCRWCEVGFGRGHGVYDDERCIVCDGTVKGWDDRRAFEAKTTTQGDCSWCFEHGKHRLEEVNSVARRDVYTCESCFARTLHCSKCESAFTRGGMGWDDQHCAKCDGDIDDWNGFRAKKHTVLSKSHGVEAMQRELRRSSPYRDQAVKAGMVRPFLLLASMDPACRNQVATVLGFSLYNQPYLGDAHAESWDILDSKMKGIHRRASESWESLNPLANNANWYETVHRVGVEIFKKLDARDLSYRDSSEACTTSRSTVVPELEDEFIRKLSALQAVQMTQEQIAALDALEGSEEVEALARNMRAAGIASAEVIRYAVNGVYQAIRMGGFNSYIITVKIAAAMNRNLGTKLVMSHATKAVSQFAAALNVVGWVWVAVDVLNLAAGSSHARLFPAVIQILNHKLFLAAEGIRIEEFY